MKKIAVFLALMLIGVANCYGAEKEVNDKNFVRFEIDMTYSNLTIEVYNNDTNTFIERVFLNKDNKIYYYNKGLNIRIVETTSNSAYEKMDDIILKDESKIIDFNRQVKNMNVTFKTIYRGYGKYIESVDSDTDITIYDENFKKKIVVACEDFTDSENELVEFTKLANSVTKIDNKFKCNIEDVYSVIDNTKIIKNKEEIIKSFWDMFVADALIGNPDRHLDNWGLLYNIKTNSYIFSPIYDCGSCLHALFSNEKKEKILANKIEMKNVAYNIKSAYSMNHRRIFYSEIFKNPPKDLKGAILRIAPRIDMDKINAIIDSVPAISDVDKQFFKESIKIRKELIIDKALENI